MSRKNQVCNCQNLFALGAQDVGVGCIRVFQRAVVRRPAQVGEHDHLLGCAFQDPQVLEGVTGCGEQPHRWGEVYSVRRPGVPVVTVVGGLEVFAPVSGPNRSILTVWSGWCWLNTTSGTSQADTPSSSTTPA